MSEERTVYDVILEVQGKEDCPHDHLRRLAEVGSDTRCVDCGIVMKAREWPAFKEQQAERRKN